MDLGDTGIGAEGDASQPPGLNNAWGKRNITYIHVRITTKGDNLPPLGAENF